MKARLFLAACALALATSLAPKAAAQSDFKSWPKGSSPSEVGKRVAERFAASPHFNFMRLTPPRTITYPETCTWYGALTFAKVSKDKELTKRLVARFDPPFGPEASLIPEADHVDPSVFGAVPFELYI